MGIWKGSTFDTKMKKKLRCLRMSNRKNEIKIKINSDAIWHQMTLLRPPFFAKISCFSLYELLHILSTDFASMLANIRKKPPKNWVMKYDFWQEGPHTANDGGKVMGCCSFWAFRTNKFHEPHILGWRTIPILSRLKNSYNCVTPNAILNAYTELLHTLFHMSYSPSSFWQQRGKWEGLAQSHTSVYFFISTLYVIREYLLYHWAAQLFYFSKKLSKNIFKQLLKQYLRRH